jgi:ClpP class serine protease
MERHKLLPLADGRIYTANQAWEKDLIDGVCFYGEALSKFRGAYDFNEEDVEVRDFYYHRLPTFYDRLFMAFSALNDKSELEEYVNYIQLPVHGPAYYFVGY